MDYKTILLYILVVWSLVVTGVIVWIVVFFLKLSKKIDKGNLIKILDTVLKTEKDNLKSVRAIEKEIETIYAKQRLHLQKIALERFNPFEETGGGHSFSLALLDENDDGVILTGLHTRERTRIYAKNIRGGKSKIDLSREEEKVLKKAIKQTS